MKAGPIIDERDGETEDEAKERHLRELANARAAIAQADRVLENGRLAARANGYREAARRLRGVVAASLEMLRLRFPCTEALTGTLPALINHAARDVELSAQYERVADRVQERYAEAKLAEVERERDAALEDLANVITSKAEMGDRLTRERDAALAELQAEKDGALRLRQRFGARSQETFPAFVERLALHRDCSVARAKELEAELRYVSAEVGLMPGYVSDSGHRVAQLLRQHIENALHPPPPASASDRKGTEHHDAAADPEDGCQAGARRP